MATICLRATVTVTVVYFSRRRHLCALWTALVRAKPGQSDNEGCSCSCQLCLSVTMAATTEHDAHHQVANSRHAFAPLSPAHYSCCYVFSAPAWPCFASFIYRAKPDFIHPRNQGWRVPEHVRGVKRYSTSSSLEYSFWTYPPPSYASAWTESFRLDHL